MIAQTILIATLTLTGAASYAFGAPGAPTDQADADYKAGRYREALSAYVQATEAHKDWWYPRYQAGRARTKLGEHDLALMDFAEALKIVEDDRQQVDTEIAIVHALVNAGSPKQALEHVAEIKPLLDKLAPDDRGKRELVVHKLEGMAHFVNRAYNEAVTAFTAALAMKSDDGDTLARVAACYLQLENFVQAGEAFEKALDLRPGDVGTACNAADAYLNAAVRAGGEDKAVLVKAARLGERCASGSGVASKGWIQVARARIGMKEFVAAEEALKRAETADPKNADVHLYRGRAFNSQKKYEKAVAALKKLVAAAPDRADAWENLGYSLEMAGKRDKEALAAYEKAASLAPSDSLATAVDRVKGKLSRK